MLLETQVHSVLKEQQQFRENLKYTKYTAESSNLQCLTPDSTRQCPCSDASSSLVTLENSLYFMEPEISLPCSQTLETSLIEFSSFKIRFNITLAPMPLHFVF